MRDQLMKKQTTKLQEKGIKDRQKDKNKQTNKERKCKRISEMKQKVEDNEMERRKKLQFRVRIIVT